MKLSSNWALKKIGEDVILMPLGQTAYDLSVVINLNETSCALYELLMQNQSEEDLVKYLLANYEVEETQARNDVKEFLDELKKKKILEDD